MKPPWMAQTFQKPPITRQIAINTLAAMHRRFSLPGPVQPHSRPIAEFRASANKSLDMLRQTVQSAVTREIDQVIKKYLEVSILRIIYYDFLYYYFIDQN